MLNLFLFEAKFDDCDHFYELANDIDVRNVSFNQNSIDYQTHIKWYTEKLNSINDKLFILKYENNFVGQIRFEIKNDHAIVSISILKKYRGLGYGSIILNKGCREFWKFFNLDLIAYVKSDNTNSYNLFIKNRFIFNKYLFINNTKAIELKSKYEETNTNR